MLLNGAAPHFWSGKYKGYLLLTTGCLAANLGKIPVHRPFVLLFYTNLLSQVNFQVPAPGLVTSNAGHFTCQDVQNVEKGKW
jgi:hypothetical protein